MVYFMYNMTFIIVIEVSPQELMKLLEENPARFTKCSFRVDTSVHPQGYFGRVPAPDSPDIKIPGRVRGVYEDDVVVLELQPSAKARDEKELKEGTVVIGYVKGEHNFRLSFIQTKIFIIPLPPTNNLEKPVLITEAKPQPN